jgi:hypothetical protein
MAAGATPERGLAEQVSNSEKLNSHSSIALDDVETMSDV